MAPYFILGAALLLFLAGCGGDPPVKVVAGFEIYAEGGATVPPGIGAVIQAVRKNPPPYPGARPLYDGEITFQPAPFVCSGAGKVWGCSASGVPTPSVRVVTSASAVDGALVEELGHFVWENICGPCEAWTATGGTRDPRFEAWITETKGLARLAAAFDPSAP
jgi:hypothetical protein